MSERLLNVLSHDESAGFSQVTRRDQSWFSCHYQSIYCYVKSHVAGPPRTQTTIATKRALVTIVFTGTKRLALDVIPREKTFHLKYVLVILIPESPRENTNARRRAGNSLLLVSMDGR
jgi:hypothetical protein